MTDTRTAIVQDYPHVSSSDVRLVPVTMPREPWVFPDPAPEPKDDTPAKRRSWTKWGGQGL